MTRRFQGSVSQSSGSKRAETLNDQRDSIVLTPKNVQALRTLFNVAHRLHNVLGPSWVLVLETLAALDRAIHSPHATTQGLCTYGIMFLIISLSLLKILINICETWHLMR